MSDQDWGHIEVSLGFYLKRVRSHNISLPSRDKHGHHNRGFENLRKSATTLEKGPRMYLPNPLPIDLKSFAIYLQETFSGLESGEYVLVGWSGVRKRRFWKWGINHWGKYGKLWKWSRPYCGIARFEVHSGTVEFSKHFMYNRKHQVYKIWNMLPWSAEEDEDARRVSDSREYMSGSHARRAREEKEYMEQFKRRR